MGDEFERCGRSRALSLSLSLPWKNNVFCTYSRVEVRWKSSAPKKNVDDLRSLLQISLALVVASPDVPVEYYNPAKVKVVPVRVAPVIIRVVANNPMLLIHSLPIPIPIPIPIREEENRGKNEANHPKNVRKDRNREIVVRGPKREKNKNRD